jgi:hypothetical protein
VYDGSGMPACMPEPRHHPPKRLPALSAGSPS